MEMIHLEQHVYLKIQDIVEKLHKLDCTLLGNKDDAWIMELLFKPGFHRCHLIEWILSKLGYNVGKMSGPQNSAENRMKSLQSTVSDWGICRENCYDIIEGTAAMKEQLEFWCSLVDIIWLKYKITSNISMTDSDEGIALSPEKTKTKLICEEFEDASFSVNKFCESGNIQHIFKRDLQLLAPDVEREIKNLSPSKLEMLEISDPQKVKELEKKNSLSVSMEIYKKLCLNKLLCDENEDEARSEFELNELEEELHKISTDFQSSYNIFCDVYNDLKPLILNAKAEDFVDVGPAFQKVELLLEELLKLKKSFSNVESSNLKLLKVNSELEVSLNQETFFDENYVNTFKLLKHKN